MSNNMQNNMQYMHNMQHNMKKCTKNMHIDMQNNMRNNMYYEMQNKKQNNMQIIIICKNCKNYNMGDWESVFSKPYAKYAKTNMQNMGLKIPYAA